ncbi:MAG: rhomboid family intramembrane serine protease [Rhodanobacteraceae bacterium]|nr:rhomboid family intramembrane serine protease [Rhodanobacteraceae bacterium]MBL0041576.1 rhomboid family intramembrane serine protease [Xanthomonadales bacterium]MBP6078037.1 rhomboid family intramembrane serine protease [Xanthomonadales bacterium]MBP7623715.1 rhomboid family intramembrane serine protease [Xanthomonadales bacterium]
MSSSLLRFHTPVVSRSLIVACVIVFLLQAQIPEQLVIDGALWPLGPEFAPWQVLSYAFLHGGLTHLLFNMLGLHMFGSDVERIIGPARFALLYVASVVCAALAQLAVNHITASPWPTVGASGGLFGVMLVFALLFPKAKIVPLIPPIPMPAWLFVTLYAGVELWMGVTGTQQGVAHFAHLGGLVGGALVWLYWRAEFHRRAA